MRTVPVFASLVVNPRRSIAPAAQFRRRHNRTCQLSLRDLVVQHDGHHPCWKAAHFLPCTRPPDVIRLHSVDVYTTVLTLAAHSLPRALDFKRCQLEGMKMIRPLLLSLAPLRDPFVVLRLSHRRATCRRLSHPSTTTSMARRSSRILGCRTSTLNPLLALVTCSGSAVTSWPT